MVFFFSSGLIYLWTHVNWTAHILTV
jgi:hypothetical protein